MSLDSELEVISEGATCGRLIGALEERSTTMQLSKFWSGECKDCSIGSSNFWIAEYDREEEYEADPTAAMKLNIH